MWIPGTEDDDLNMDFFFLQLRLYGLYDFETNYSALDKDLPHNDARDHGYRRFQNTAFEVFEKYKNNNMEGKDWEKMMKLNWMYKQACMNWYGENYSKKYQYVYTKLMEGRIDLIALGLDSEYLMRVHVCFEMSQSDVRKMMDTRKSNGIDVTIHHYF
jgi:hypothetical protein